MKTTDLSERLKQVASFIPKGARLADIGSDHAKLPCYAIEQGLAVTAVAGEVAAGPLAAAEKNIRARGHNGTIRAKLGDGLAVLENENVDTITIAGMGGPLIARILDEGKSLLSGVTKLILQPNVAADHIRVWLYENGWSLAAETIMEEDGHVYEILTAEPGDPDAAYAGRNRDMAMWLGPYLLDEKNNEAFKKKWTKEKEQLTNIKAQLARGEKTPALLEKQKKLDRQLGWLEEALA
ncbi:tRNA (adenine(22)-N(1))-methyltransferase TrmK [Alteribacter lacisalsi]|uniref:tRNA (Adenine(22)-N(1))-methyltransferase TrmK n=1 Tax=Alteribacter lacisalsi TaxID=2045244 RepID=A0A2W0HXZ9_9BACI|nr:tRNA (adenine(22)-N(1))-methyltransferase TrmK [Alteribacter lacisalsi]PYZ98668.1 tRNA (adenine(22)-N(1))-methyltransferase TrmK [Alteribacter lacisalsi]